METSLPLSCEEEEPPCRPMTHDVNNSLPPVVERGWITRACHAGRGGGCGEGIKRRSFLCSGGVGGSFVENPVPRVRVESSCEESSKRIPLEESREKSPVRRVPVEVPCQEFVERSRSEL